MISGVMVSAGNIDIYHHIILSLVGSFIISVTVAPPVKETVLLNCSTAHICIIHIQCILQKLRIIILDIIIAIVLYLTGYIDVLTAF